MKKIPSGGNIMPQEKVTFEQFMSAVTDANKPFIQSLHDLITEKNGKSAYEEKKNGYLASYKVGKPPRALINMGFRKNGMFVRVYGENISAYPDFMHALPAKMMDSIKGSGECKRLTQNGCNPKCAGYDFIIAGERFQKCRYNCFEFFMGEGDDEYIKTFVENEMKERGLM